MELRKDRTKRVRRKDWEFALESLDHTLASMGEATGIGKYYCVLGGDADGANSTQILCGRWAMAYNLLLRRGCAGCSSVVVRGMAVGLTAHRTAILRIDGGFDSKGGLSYDRGTCGACCGETDVFYPWS